MMRKITALVVIFILGALLIEYRDRQLSMERTKTRDAASLSDGLTDPSNWKVEPVDPAMPGRRRTYQVAPNGSRVATAPRYGMGDSPLPPLWARRNVKASATPATNISRNAAVEPSPMRVLDREQRPVAKPAAQSLVGVPNEPPLIRPVPNRVAANQNGTGSVAAVDAEHRDLMRHAQFLIKAGLAPVAKEPLQQIIREVPGTPIAREASLTLDTIRN